jgi:AmmeMemoRadiSam system protein B
MEGFVYWSGMRKLLLTLTLAAIATACAAPDDSGDPSVEIEHPPDTAAPYLDDETARQWHKAGSDYPGDRIELDDRVHGLLQEVDVDDKKKAFAIVAPHAGFRYSGASAASAYARVEVPDLVILLAPKHHGVGASPALWNEGPWLVPGHALFTRTDVAERWAELTGEDVAFKRPPFVQKTNHPSENQLPFLSTINPDVELVPWVVTDHQGHDFKDFDVERIETWGKALADLVTELENDGEEVLVVASTDLVHGATLEQAEEEDARLMQHVVDLDVEGLHQWVTDDGITICGEIATAIAMSAARELGHDDTELTALTSSHAENGNEDNVVGYGAAVFWHTE